MPNTDTDLYRALLKGACEGEFDVDGIAKDGLLYPGFEPTSFLDNNDEVQERLADVDYTIDAETGERKVKPGGGTSLFDVAGWFGYNKWNYFQIPSGTDYPASLFIRKSSEAQKKKKMIGTHYQIEPKIPMTVGALKGALDTFARNAVARSVEMSR